MNNVKEQLKNVLEDEKRFTNIDEDKIISLIKQKQKPFISWKIKMVVGAFVMASLLLVATIITPKEEQTTSPHEVSEMEQNLIDTFELMMAGKPYELLHYEIGFEQENDAIIIYQLEENENVIDTNIFTYENDEWVNAQTASTKIDKKPFWTVFGDGPYLVTGTIRSPDIEKILVGTKEVKTVELSNGYTYFASIEEEAVNRVVAKYLDGRYERLKLMHNEDDINIEFVQPVQSQYTIEYKLDTMTRSNEEYMSYPVVIDPSITSFNRGDVVYSDDKISTPTISRIIALPGETFEVRNGTILINGLPLEEDLGYAKIDGEFVYEAYMKKNTLESINEEEVKRIFDLSVNPVMLKANQYMTVGDNWNRSGMSLTDSKYIIGKVIGYYEEEATFTWPESEKALYKKFKKDYDIEILRDMSPFVLARLYLYSYYLEDYETAYHFLTTREDQQRWSLQAHLEYGRRESKVFGDSSLYYLQLAEAISNGKFIITDATSGYIQFTLNGEMQGFQLVENEDGIWQVTFSPMQ